MIRHMLYDKYSSMTNGIPLYMNLYKNCIQLGMLMYIHRYNCRYNLYIFPCKYPYMSLSNRSNYLYMNLSIFLYKCLNKNYYIHCNYVQNRLNQHM